MKKLAILLTLLASLATASPLHADAFQCLDGEGAVDPVCTATVTLDGVERTVTVPEGQFFRPIAAESVVTQTGTWAYTS